MASPSGRSHRTDRRENLLGRPTVEKIPEGSESGIRTKTDTGGWGEYPKALGRTVVKELGKLTP